MLDLILYPAHVANGTISREKIKTRINQSASDCELSALDKLQYLKSLDKATSAILKDKNKDGHTLVDLALEEALAKKEVQDIIAQKDLAGGKKTLKAWYWMVEGAAYDQEHPRS